MDWRSGRRSNNVEDARGGGGGGGLRAGGLGIGGVAVVVVLGLLTGHSPTEILSMLSQDDTSAVPHGAPPANDQAADFVSAILGETEDVWGTLFQQSGQTYVPPHLVMFSGGVRSGCGGATSATGPFYCPVDHKVYLDTSFFDEMSQHLGGGGDFANAYVIAHEVGHHVQSLLGLDQKMERAQRSGRGVEGANGLSVRMELQADCFAGVWANHAEAKLHWLQTGDVDEALATASAIGDDRLQKQSQGEVVPDSFTHGTSAQRVRWFKAGFGSGDVNNCDTFGATSL
jgi:predicted metalloprotease